MFEFRRHLGPTAEDGQDTSPIDMVALREAVASLRRHPVMRSVIVDGAHREVEQAVTGSGTGARLPLTVTVDTSPVDDATGAGIDEFCAARRASILARHADYGAGELGWIDVVRRGSTEIIHLTFSLVAADLAGVGVIVNDLAAAYAGEGKRPQRTFAAIDEDERAGAQARARRTHRDDSAVPDDDAGILPPPPVLPRPGATDGRGGNTVMAGGPGIAGSPGHGVTRYSTVMDIDRWERIGRVADAAGASRPGLVLAVYRHAIGLWTGDDDVSIVVPGIDRRSTRGDVLDRTRTWVARPKAVPGESLGEAASEATRELRRRIRVGLDSGQELREALRRGDGHPGILPVVLTCGSEEVLFTPQVTAVFGNLVNTGSVTPQVLCDLQVLRLLEDTVHVALDIRDGAYAGTVGEELFATVVEGLLAVADAVDGEGSAAAAAATPVDDLVRLPAATRARRSALNSVPAPPVELLHTPFLRCVAATPDAVAVIDPAGGEPLTYAELHHAALRLAGELTDDVAVGDIVAVRLPKGRDQVTAVLAVLYLGATYLPVNVDAPQQRIDAVTAVAAPVTVIDFVDPDVYLPGAVGEEGPADLPRAVSPSSSAYVIFTSGSTGTPKGVVMSHSAASNTVLAVRDRHGIGPSDRVLAVSELDFDLSVFDIFGLLGAGGSVVCIADDQRRDAFAWSDMVRGHGVTLWNSAPALAEMLVVAGGGPLPLRTVLVSGDWVSPALPERIRSITGGDDGGGARLVAMGGATEAGIWSNEYIIDGPDDLSPDWVSVPYGHPLPGQAYRVVDEYGRDCPTGVVGELWIGGSSLAEGYLGREELTNERFTAGDTAAGADQGCAGDADRGIWYRTGDHGYWATVRNSGEHTDLLFFVGRRDNQVKIRGHRIELGDVEHHLRAVDGVAAAVVLPEPGHRALSALVSPEPGAEIDGDDIRRAVAESVPGFMVPRRIAVAGSMTLTPNGKIDRTWAEELLEGAGRPRAVHDGVAAASSPLPSDAVSTMVRDAWAAVLGEDVLAGVDRDANFFSLGGDSVAATTVCCRLREDGMAVTAADLFANPCLGSFTEALAGTARGALTSAPSDPAPEGGVDPADTGVPFPLAPLQRAYALGADGIGGTVRSPTVYATILRRPQQRGGRTGHSTDGGFTAADVGRDVRRLVDDCPSLRVIRVDDTSQRVVATSDAVTVSVLDSGQGATDDRGATLREFLCHRDPVTPIEILLPYDGAHELGVMIDYLALDGRSLAEVLAALEDVLSGGTTHGLAGSVAGFARFCRESTRKRIETDAVGDAPDSAPPAPDLPVIGIPGRTVGFRSLRATVPAAELSGRAARHGVTVSAYVLAEYGAVLAAASNRPEVGVVVPLTHRPPAVQPEEPVELGCFSRLGVCRCSVTPDYRSVRQQLAGQVDSGSVAVVSSGRTGRYPAVFTSVVGYDARATGTDAVEQVWSVTRTPGVLIDCQMTTEGHDRETVGIRWDIPVGVLDDARVRALFRDFLAAVGATAVTATGSAVTRAEPVSATVTGLLREVTGILDGVPGGDSDVLTWARPVVLAWRRFIDLGPVGTGMQDAPVGWSAQDARFLADVVRGRVRRYSLLEHPVLSPRSLAAVDPVVVHAMEVLRSRLEAAPGAVVVEIGFGTDPSIAGGGVNWTVVEPDDRTADLATVGGRNCVDSVGQLREAADLVVVCGTLHRDPRLANTLAKVPLAPGAEVHVIEVERLTAASLLSAAVVDPSILDGDLTVSGIDQVTTLLRDRGLRLRYMEAEDGHSVVLRAVASGVAGTAPDRALGGAAGNHTGDDVVTAGLLEDIWRRHLPGLSGASSPLPPDTDFFLNGGDSFTATHVLADLQAAGISGLRAVDIFNNPTIAGLLGRIGEAGHVAPLPMTATSVTANRWPLTLVQQAYLAGEDPDQLLGGVPARCWFVFDAPGLDDVRLRSAVEAVVRRHEVLRAVLDDDVESGQTVFRVCADGGLSSAVIEHPDPAGAVRDLVRDPRHVGPLTVVVGRDRIGVSMSNLLLDGSSMVRLMEELSEAYVDPEEYAARSAPVMVDLAGYLGRRPWLTDYSAAVETGDGTVVPPTLLRERLDRVLAELPPAPLVPARREMTMLTSLSMTRISADVPHLRWSRMRELLATRRLTPAAVVMAAFARALAAETGEDALTLNLTRFDRDLTVPGVAESLGDFTTLSLVGLRDLRSEDLFRTSSAAQEALTGTAAPERDTLRLAARAVRTSGDPAAGLFPVVFTCGLGLAGEGTGHDLRERSFGVQIDAGSTTPQVVLDLQVVDDGDGLHLTADYVEQILSVDRVQRILDGTVGELARAAEEDADNAGTTEDPVTAVWASALGLPVAALTDDTGFFREGGDSLTATTVVRELRDLGIDASLRVLLANPALGDFRRAVGVASADVDRPEDAWFDLTDVQASYLMGRTSAYEDGGVACQGYAEFTVDTGLLDPDSATDPVAAVHRAWSTVVGVHDMLRAVIDREGRQRIDHEVDIPVQVVRVPDDAGRAVTGRSQVRDRLRTKNYLVGQAPMMDIVLTVGHGAPVVHLSVDLIIADYVSIRTIIADLDWCLAHPGKPLPAPGVSFRSWIEHRARYLATDDGRAGWERDRAWWGERLNQLPPSLEFSPAPDRDHDVSGGTTRRSLHLGAGDWAGLRSAAADAGVTPSCLVLGMFMTVARRYTDIGMSGSDRALVTLTTVDRSGGSGDLSRVVGDFTSTVLVDAPLGVDVVSNAVGAQDSLTDALDHSAYPGVRVLRDLRRTGGDDRGRIPVVFTSTVGVDTAEAPRLLRPVPGTAISKTPQVLLDVQLTPAENGITVDWDSRDGGFHPAVLDQAFSDFREVVTGTARSETVTALPRRYPEAVDREQVPVVTSDDPAGMTLHGPFLRRALQDPDATAVIHGDRTLSRGELCAIAVGIVSGLPGGRGPLIVEMEPGPEQIAAQIAALLGGRAFVPVDPTWPESRRLSVRDTLSHAASESGGAADLVQGEPVVLTSTGGELPSRDAWQDVVRAALHGPIDREESVDPVGGTADELAYVIFTSGSTGTPKGVAVTHAQVRTTLDDIHHRTGLTDADRVLAVSRPSFDLAVFNVFGLLGAGGAVVLPSCGTVPDPETWTADIRRHGVTVWNSVPAQLTIELDYLDVAPGESGLPVRCALVSGDTVPSDQAARLRKAAPGAEFLALGGATEGAVWSIVHRCTPEEDSVTLPVPYGRALSRQAVWVLNRDGEPVAPGQRGEIVIAGDGVAAGYLGADDRSDRSFGVEGTTGERCYHTGDAGTVDETGVVLFNGRVGEGQVKIRGHRIELGEVEAGLRTLDGVADALVAVSRDGERRELVAAVTPAGARDATDPDALREHLWAVHGRACAGEQADAFRRIHHLAVDAALDAMTAQISRAVRISDGDDGPAATTEVIARALDAAGHVPLIERWLGMLESNGRVTRRNGAVVSVAAPPVPSVVRDRWAEIGTLDREIGYGTVQLTYLRACLENLPGLLDGSVDPLSLLFPEGEMGVARASYGENMLSEYLNTICSGAISHRVESATVDRPCRIVEIGGGVGGTTADVLAALDGVPTSRWDYLFTDVSRYFTETAEKEWPVLRTSLLDINLPAPEQGVPDGSADVVLCANVLHNSKHIDRALEAVGKMLAPGGIAVIIDSTADSAPLMASMEFKEGLDGATDVRLRTGSPFLTMTQWRDVLERSPLQTVSVMPPAGDVLELGAQHVFVARRGSGPESRGAVTGQLSASDLVAAAGGVLPGYMVPRHIEVVDALPMTVNGKRDRSAVVTLAGAPAEHGDPQPVWPNPVVTAPEESRTEGTVHSGDPVEDAWRDVLGLDPATPLKGDMDFHDLGGDSLLLARCIGQMRRAVDSDDLPSWDETLRAIVADPTPDGCRRALGVRSEPVTEGPTVVTETSPGTPVTTAPRGVTGPRITELAGSPGPVTVLVHDGSGTTGPYEALVEELKSRRTGTVLGVERSVGDGYLATAPEVLFHDLTERYTAALLDRLAETTEQVHVVGYCMGGLLAVGIADRLAACGVDVTATAVSSYRIPFTVSDPRLLDYSFARLIRARPEDMGIDLEEERLSRAIRVACDAGIQDISREILERCSDPELRRRLQAMPLDSDTRIRRFLGSGAGAHWERESLESLKEIYLHSLAAVAAYEEPPVTVPVRFLKHRDPLSFLPELGDDMTAFWEEHCLGELEVVEVDGDHFTCLNSAHAPEIAGLLQREMAR